MQLADAVKNIPLHRWSTFLSGLAGRWRAERRQVGNLRVVRLLTLPSCVSPFFSFSCTRSSWRSTDGTMTGAAHWLLPHRTRLRLSQTTNFELLRSCCRLFGQHKTNRQVAASCSCRSKSGARVGRQQLPNLVLPESLPEHVQRGKLVYMSAAPTSRTTNPLILNP